MSVRWRGREGHGAERVVNLCCGWRDITDITRAGSKQTSNTKLTSRAIFGLTNAFDNLRSYCHRGSLFDLEELVHLVCGSHRDVLNWKLNSDGKRSFREAERTEVFVEQWMRVIEQRMRRLVDFQNQDCCQFASLSCQCC